MNDIILPSNLFRHLDDIERDIVTAALVQHHLNRTKAGQAIGLTLRQMRYAMDKSGIKIVRTKLVTIEPTKRVTKRPDSSHDSHSAE